MEFEMEGKKYNVKNDNHLPSDIKMNDIGLSFRRCNNCSSDFNVKEITLGSFNIALCEGCRGQLLNVLDAEVF